MKVGIMQPYFFPYIGYFSLIAAVDEFIVFDPVQFIKHGWIERNRILKPQEGWQYISVPLQKYHQTTRICDIRIKNEEDWKGKIFRQLEHYKKKAPNYDKTIDVIHEALSIETDSITQLDSNILDRVAKYLGIKTKIHLYQDMELQLGPVTAADEWALEICRSIPGVDSYLNPEGGLSFFNRGKYEQNGIHIDFQKMDVQEYSQRRGEFIPNLSIIDVMMFNSVDEIRAMLDQYTLI